MTCTSNTIRSNFRCILWFIYLFQVRILLWTEAVVRTRPRVEGTLLWRWVSPCNYMTCTIRFKFLCIPYNYVTGGEINIVSTVLLLPLCKIWCPQIKQPIFSAIELLSNSITLVKFEATWGCIVLLWKTFSWQVKITYDDQVHTNKCWDVNP